LSDRAIAKKLKRDHVTISNWRKTKTWKEEESRHAAEEKKRIEAEQRAKAIALKEHEETTRNTYREELLRARDNLKECADSQLLVSKAMARYAGKAIAHLSKAGDDPVKGCKAGIDITRWAKESSAITRNTMEVYQRIYAIEELLEALKDAQT